MGEGLPFKIGREACLIFLGSENFVNTYNIFGSSFLSVRVYMLTVYSLPYRNEEHWETYNFEYLLLTTFAQDYIFGPTVNISDQRPT